MRPVRHPAHFGRGKALLDDSKKDAQRVGKDAALQVFAKSLFELASAGQFDGQGDHHTPKPYVRKAFCKYLECGIFAHGFARAWCDDCGHDYFVAYSCKGRGAKRAANRVGLGNRLGWGGTTGT